MFKINIPLSQDEIEIKIKEKKLLTGSVRKAIKQAIKSHALHTASGGKSFLAYHLWPVVNIFLQAANELNPKDREDALIATILHDSLEDDPSLSREDLLEEFSSRQVKWIENLTRQDGYDQASNEEKLVLARKFMDNFINMEKAPRIVKLSDRLINQYLIALTAETMPLTLKRYITETEEMFIPLAEKTSPRFLEAIKQQLQVMKELDKV